jgi:hypothetical protein
MAVASADSLQLELLDTRTVEGSDNLIVQYAVAQG